MNLLFPDKVYNRITDIPIDFLVKNQIKGVILDVDNTLTTHNDPIPAKGVIEWLDSLQRAGIKPIILSNNRLERIKPFAETLGIGFIPNGLKPLPLGYLRCKYMLNVKKSELAVIGDQIFTDILGGKMLSILSILVEPIEPEEDNFIRFKRRIERRILRKYDLKYGRL